MSGARICLCLIFVTICSSADVCAQELKSFEIYGDVSRVNIPVEKIEVSYYRGNEFRKDSCLVKNGKYYYKGELSEPEKIWVLTVRGKDQYRSYKFYAEPGSVMHVKSDTSFSNIEATGSATQAAYTDWTKLSDPYMEEVERIAMQRTPYDIAFEKSHQPADSLKSAELTAQMTGIFKKLNEVALQYASSHLNSPAIVEVIGMIYLPEYQKQREDLFNQIPEERKQSRLGRSLADEIAVGIGHEAPDFSSPDTAGKMVSFSSFRGNWVLLDFWASWCGPCRAESPYLLAAYKKYKEKGFAIFSVSLDIASAKKAWLEAIQKDGTGIWTQTCSFTGRNDPASIAYGHIGGIPANFLIDPQGKIVATNLRGPELEKKLSEVLQ